jgi:hypothetical protein
MGTVFVIPSDEAVSGMVMLRYTPDAAWQDFVGSRTKPTAKCVPSRPPLTRGAVTTC